MHAGLLGAEVIAKEERDRTSEFLYPKPVSRARVLSEKLLAAAANILLMFGVTVASTIWITGYYNKGYGLNNQVMLLMWGVLLFQIVSFAFGAFFAGIFKNPKLPATAISTVIMASYLAYVFVDISSNLSFLQYLTPFSYFSAAKILGDGRLDPFYVGLVLLVSTLLFVLTYIFYDRRDLTV
jgi:ABC-2 type transport system permease protein